MKYKDLVVGMEELVLQINQLSCLLVSCRIFIQQVFIDDIIYWLILKKAIFTNKQNIGIYSWLCFKFQAFSRRRWRRRDLGRNWRKANPPFKKIHPWLLRYVFFSQNNNKTPISVGGIPVNRNVMFLSLSLYRVEHKAVSK